MKSRTNSAGFTMIELLVVIAVIAVLMALLLPTIHRAKVKADQIACLSNERQINLSYRLRLEDNESVRGAEMVAWECEEWGRKELGWICPRAPVRAGAEAHVEIPVNECPEEFGDVNSAWLVFRWSLCCPDYINGQCTGGSLSGGDFRAGSYAVNLWVAQADGLGRRAFERESQITHPVATPVLADGFFRWVEWAPEYAFCWDGPNGFFPSLNSVIIPRHGSRPHSGLIGSSLAQPLPGAVNVSFFDGHGELVKLDRLWELYWDRLYQPAKRPGLP